MGAEGGHDADDDDIQGEEVERRACADHVMLMPRRTRCG
jgi:hypothetical protein